MYDAWIKSIGFRFDNCSGGGVSLECAHVALLKIKYSMFILNEGMLGGQYVSGMMSRILLGIY